MTTLTIKTILASAHDRPDIPATARGRALYTVAWFMHGAVHAHQFDNAGLTLTQLNNKGNGRVVA